MKIAIIGSGISGCAAAWELGSWANVTVFESESRLGGHTHTQTVRVGEQSINVDTGFIVFNHRTYPGLKKWFDFLGVDSAPSDMSFSASLNHGELEWCGTNLNSVFAQRRNLASPKFWKMLNDILRFNREAPRDAARYREMPGGGPNLGEYLDKQGYRGLFLDAYLLPMAGAIWSCPTEQMRAFPMATFTRFCENHGLLAVTNRPQWYTVRNGSQQYIDKLQTHQHKAGHRVVWRTGHRVHEVQPGVFGADSQHQGVTISGCVANGSAFQERFDAVVLACHSDQSATLLPKGSPAQQLVSKIRYQRNIAVLHTDTALMPKRKNAWASWNYLHTQNDEHGSVSVTYWMNRLQPLPTSTPVLVTLNPVSEPNPSHIINTMDYSHPIFDGPAVQAQKDLIRVQGNQNIWLAGAWTRYGFHEDGFQSGLNAAFLIQSALVNANREKSIARAA